MTKLLFFLKIYFQHTAKHFLGMFDSNSVGILGLFILPRFRWAWIPLAAQQLALIKVFQLGCFENVGEIVLNITGVTGCWESRSRSWAWTSWQDWSPIALLFLELLRKPDMTSDLHPKNQIFMRTDKDVITQMASLMKQYFRDTRARQGKWGNATCWTILQKFASPP